MPELIEVELEYLLLDEDNPRIGSADSQASALEYIINLNDAYFRNLMISIKNNGLDPGDSLYVIEGDDSDEYVVLEGNRRISALKVLDNTNILNGTKISDRIKKSLLRASSNFDINKINPIRCVKFDTREEAEEWIFRRHTGTMDGEGRIQWGPLEIQRFSGDHSLLDIIDFVGRNADYTSEEWESTKSTISSRKSSNLSRVLARKIHCGLADVAQAVEIA